ncbi:MAG TPA: hypothetical protein VN759_06665, partial [Pseudolysinimonas sp.]|nr:hypothetical protein [Pseudolysinimonas sp.]
MTAAAGDLLLSVESAATALDDAADDVHALNAAIQVLWAEIVVFHQQLDLALAQAGATMATAGPFTIADLFLLAEADALMLENEQLERRIVQVNARWAEIVATAAGRVRRASGGEAAQLRLPYAEADPSAFDVHPENDASVYDLLGQWASGQGPRHQSFHDGDPLTLILQQDDHLADVRTELAQRAAASGLEIGVPLTRNYSVGSQGIGGPIRDGEALASGGASGGNLADAFLGSYDLTMTPVRQNADG